jgi:ankyrin repeat protein
MKTRETISTSADGGQATTNNNENEDDGMQKCASCPTASDLLELCKLPESSSATERQRRLATLELWRRFHPDKLATLLVSRESCDKKNGCLPLHWAAGTGFDEMIDTIIDLHHDDEGDSSTSNKPKQQEHTTNTIPVVAAVDQNAYHPSTGRTPLHYAARNGHLPTCQLLIERHGANPHPRCGRGSVTPLQLAVWQNRLTVVRYLVEQNTATATAIVDGAATASRLTVVQERNDFNCGLMHWVGLIPRKRWGGCDTDDENDENNDGSGVLPLARYLHSMGLSYDSTPSNANTQGHTPLHKAAWGGNLALIRYFREDHDIYDKVQDEAGNYCADIAKMRGNHEVAQWLLDHGSVDRHESYRILGLEVGASDEEVRQRYRDLARRRHPDKKQQQQQQQ